MDWFYAESGRQIGPVDDASFNNLVAAGTIHPGTLVWRTGMANWQPYGAIRPTDALAATPAPDAVLFCSECGKSYPGGELITFGSSLVCAACKPVFTQKLREGVQLAGAVQYAGFWIRFLAVVIDGVLLNIVAGVLFSIIFVASGIDFLNPERVQAQIWRILALEGVFGLVAVVMGAAYETFFIGKYGATPGKMVCRVEVIGAGGGRLTYGQALGRHFAKWLSAFTMYIGFIMAAFDEEHRALHDRICNTRVIKK